MEGLVGKFCTLGIRVEGCGESAHRPARPALIWSTANVVQVAPSRWRAGCRLGSGTLLGMDFWLWPENMQGFFPPYCSHWPILRSPCLGQNKNPLQCDW